MIKQGIYSLIFIFVMLPIYWVTDKALSVKNSKVRNIFQILLFPIGIINDFVVGLKIEKELH